MIDINFLKSHMNICVNLAKKKSAKRFNMSIEHTNDYRLDLVHANWIIIVKSDIQSVIVVVVVFFSISRVFFGRI